MNSTVTSGPAFQRFQLVIFLGLTFVYAGLGHVLMRRWKRGVFWGLLYLSSILLLSNASVGESSPVHFMANTLATDLSPINVVFPATIFILCLVDLYLYHWLSKHQ